MTGWPTNYGFIITRRRQDDSSVSGLHVQVKAEYPGVTPVGFADDYKLRLHYIYTSQDDKITSDALSRCQKNLTTTGSLGRTKRRLTRHRGTGIWSWKQGHAFQAQKSCIFSLDQGTIDLTATHPSAREMEAPGHCHLVNASGGLKVMGAPLGASDWSKEWLEANTAKVHASLGERCARLSAGAALLLATLSSFPISSFDPMAPKGHGQRHFSLDEQGGFRLTIRPGPPTRFFSRQWRRANHGFRNRGVHYFRHSCLATDCAKRSHSSFRGYFPKIQWPQRP